MAVYSVLFVWLFGGFLPGVCKSISVAVVTDGELNVLEDILTEAPDQDDELYNPETERDISDKKGTPGSAYYRWSGWLYLHDSIGFGVGVAHDSAALTLNVGYWAICPIRPGPHIYILVIKVIHKARVKPIAAKEKMSFWLSLVQQTWKGSAHSRCASPLGIVKWKGWATWVVWHYRHMTMSS